LLVLKKNEHLNKTPLTTELGHRHTEALHSGRQIEISKKHYTIDVSGQRNWIKFASFDKAYKVFLIKAPNVVAN